MYDDDDYEVESGNDLDDLLLQKRGDMWKFRSGKRAKMSDWKFRGGKRADLWKFRGGKRSDYGKYSHSLQNAKLRIIIKFKPPIDWSEFLSLKNILF